MMSSSSNHKAAVPPAKLSEVPKMDLDNYISNYRGRTRIHRLLHIGSVSTYYAGEALSSAVAESKKGVDIGLYRQAVEALIGASLPNKPDAVLDDAWISKTKTAVDRETARLESELKGYKNNLIKESIRMGYDDLGKHLYASGDQADAQKTYQKERDFCQSPAHITQMNFHLLSVFLDQQAWHSIEITAQRIQHLLGKPGAEKDEGKLNAIVGLAAMSQRKYEDAARSFLAVHEVMLEGPLEDVVEENGLNEVLTPNDVATDGALCALASMDRNKLQTQVLENTRFRAFLELEPHLRRAISAFVSGRYGITLAVLESYKVDFLLDMHLYPHLASLYQAIRSKAVTEYFNAFSCITLSDLGQVIAADVVEVQSIVIDLIRSGELDAQLDLERGLVVAKTVDKRQQVLTEALQMSEEYRRTALLRLVRLEAMNAGLEVKSVPKAEASGRMDIDGANIASRLGGGWRR